MSECQPQDILAACREAEQWTAQGRPGKPPNTVVQSLLAAIDQAEKLAADRGRNAKRESAMGVNDEFSPPLDPGIAQAVLALREAGVETFDSCEGGVGHAYPEPTIRFHGGPPEGFRALAAAMQAGLAVAGLRRVWPVLDNEPTGPWWELTFTPAPG